MTYTTGDRPEAPPHPIITTAKVNVEMRVPCIPDSESSLSLEFRVTTIAIVRVQLSSLNVCIYNRQHSLFQKLFPPSLPSIHIVTLLVCFTLYMYIMIIFRKPRHHKAMVWPTYAKEEEAN